MRPSDPPWCGMLSTIKAYLCDLVVGPIFRQQTMRSGVTFQPLHFKIHFFLEENAKAIKSQHIFTQPQAKERKQEINCFLAMEKAPKYNDKTIPTSEKQWCAKNIAGSVCPWVLSCSGECPRDQPKWRWLNKRKCYLAVVITIIENVVKRRWQKCTGSR